MPTPLHPRTQVIGGVLEAECGALMQEFFKINADEPQSMD